MIDTPHGQQARRLALPVRQQQVLERVEAKRNVLEARRVAHFIGGVWDGGDGDAMVLVVEAHECDSLTLEACFGVEECFYRTKTISLNLLVLRKTCAKDAGRMTLLPA